MQSHALSQQDTQNGNTRLHVLAQSGTPAELEAYLKQSGQAGRLEARKVNSSNQAAYDLLAANPASEQEKQAMRRLFREVFLLRTCPPMKEKARLSQKLQPPKGKEAQFFKDPWQELYALCLSAANYARENIHFSSSHPDMNASSAQTHDAAWAFIEKQRAVIDEGIIFRNAAACKRYNDQVVKTKYGNCYEYAMLVAHYLFTHAPERLGLKNIHVQLAESMQGDHTFIVLTEGEHCESREGHFPSNAKVVIDAWTGIVYHPSEVQHLQMHRKVREKDGPVTNFLVPHNPRSQPVYYKHLGELKPRVLASAPVPPSGPRSKL